MFVPAGWRLIDLREPLADQVAEAVATMVLGIPLDAAPRARAHLERRLREQLAQLADADGLAYLLPVEPLRERVASPSLLVRRFRAPEGGTPLDALLALASQHAGASLLDVNHMVGLRVAEQAEVAMTGSAIREAATQLLGESREAAAVVPLVPDGQDRVAVRVRYLLGVPDDDALWVEVLATVHLAPGAEANELAPALETLFDELAKSFRWREDTDE